MKEASLAHSYGLVVYADAPGGDKRQKGVSEHFRLKRAAT